MQDAEIEQIVSPERRYLVVGGDGHKHERSSFTSALALAAETGARTVMVRRTTGDAGGFLPELGLDLAKPYRELCYRVAVFRNNAPIGLHADGSASQKTHRGAATLADAMRIAGEASRSGDVTVIIRHPQA